MYNNVTKHRRQFCYMDDMIGISITHIDIENGCSFFNDQIKLGGSRKFRNLKGANIL